MPCWRIHNSKRDLKLLLVHAKHWRLWIWCENETNEEPYTEFSWLLLNELEGALPTNVTLSRENVWRLLFKLRSSSTFSLLRRSFLQWIGVSPTPCILPAFDRSHFPNPPSESVWLINHALLRVYHHEGGVFPSKWRLGRVSCTSSFRSFFPLQCHNFLPISIQKELMICRGGSRML